MSVIIGILLTFLLSTVCGGYLLQQWQQRNWRIQQRFLGREKEYLALKDVVDEICSLMTSRTYLMKRVVLNARYSQEIFDLRLKDYEDASKLWNEKLALFYSRLRISGRSNALPMQLEQNVQSTMVLAGSSIDRIASALRAGKEAPLRQIKEAEIAMDELQVEVAKLSHDLISHVQRRRRRCYVGLELAYEDMNLPLFTTKQLFKSLFISSVYSHRIIRSSDDFSMPDR